jgi:hypothetical protein
MVAAAGLKDKWGGTPSWVGKIFLLTLVVSWPWLKRRGGRGRKPPDIVQT